MGDTLLVFVSTHTFGSVWLCFWRCVSICVFTHTCAHLCLCVCDWQVCALDIVMDIINSHWSPQVTALFEGLMGKWQTGRQLDKAIWDQTKALSWGNSWVLSPKDTFSYKILRVLETSLCQKITNKCRLLCFVFIMLNLNTLVRHGQQNHILS